ncbi:hypothetical protein, partial [Microbacterium sp. YY-01]|uniref:hypothetical protein n=1 Tax=Microbacterium sp. YY-01 TaxID=3421634 RepID=UPI003D17E433
MTFSGNDLRIATRRFDKLRPTDKIEKLPFRESREAGRKEHPILENSTACTCQMPIFLGHFVVGVFGSISWIVSDGILFL